MSYSDVERSIVRDRLHAAVRARAEAEQEYVAAIHWAKDHGWTNQAIGRAVGITEAGIRMYWKRHHPRR